MNGSHKIWGQVSPIGSSDPSSSISGSSSASAGSPDQHFQHSLGSAAEQTANSSSTLAAPVSAKLQHVRLAEESSGNSGNDDSRELPRAEEVLREPIDKCVGQDAKGPTMADLPTLVLALGRVSAGSEGHSAGTCRPCAWHWTAQGCRNGSECPYCHLCTKADFQRRTVMRRKERSKLNAARRMQQPDIGLYGSSSSASQPRKQRASLPARGGPASSSDTMPASMGNARQGKASNLRF
mmetsp:Transcript_58529/g.136774  ORF Transcript_58529/g.136774 Transcript_58529/m.136774 type:complete len:238 (+) Transcript_58529:136-849(+)